MKVPRGSGILFDKDGTLFGFRDTWGPWAMAMIAAEAAGDGDRPARLAGALGVDLVTGDFDPSSVVIAGTAQEVADAMVPHVPPAARAGLIDRINLHASKVAAVEVTPLAAFVEALRAKGFKVGLATNDAEEPARAHLAAAGVLEGFDFIAGYDSGHGAKPGPGPCLAFLRDTGCVPQQSFMVGDSLHDMAAGRAAGMTTIAVLTGIAARGDLAPMADHVIPSIRDLDHLLAAIFGG